MVTYLDLANEGRALEGSSALTADSIQLDTGDAIDTVAAANNTYNDLIEFSRDFDFNEYVEDVSVTTATNTVTQPSTQQAWDPNCINSVKRADTTLVGQLIDLLPVSLERAKTLEAELTDAGKPRFYYISRGTMYVIPTTDAAYTVKVFYQAAPFRITVDNITSTVAFPTHFYNAYIAGCHYRLRQAAGDTDWKDLKLEFQRKLNVAASWNKYGDKKRGARKFRLAWSLDRRI